MNQYLDGMVEFAEWIVDKGMIKEPVIMAMAMIRFCEEKFEGTDYYKMADDYLRGWYNDRVRSK